MPSALHETVVELFKGRPELAAELLAGVLGVEVPGWEHARLEPAEVVDLAPVQFHADAVVVLGRADGPVLAVIVEVQLRPGEDKCWSWPLYRAGVRARLRCPAVLLVVCLDAATAAWAGTPIGLGGSEAMTPLVLGPDRIPVVTVVPEAGAEVSVLSALTHGRSPDHTAVLGVLVDALAGIETSRAKLYLRLVLAALPQVARRHLEGLMRTGTYEFESGLFDELRNEGVAKGKAEGVVAFLDARGVAVPEEARTRITACTNLAQLDTWVRRAATAETIDDLFA